MFETFSFLSVDGQEIYTYVWKPFDAKAIKGVVQIIHGSIEHALRYADFAEFLCSFGYVVYAHDQRGHGKSIKSKDDLAHLSDATNGWELALKDIDNVSSIIQNNYPDIPYFILGHSMGSFLVRDYISSYSLNATGVILSGTSGKNVLMNLLKFLAKKTGDKKGLRFRSENLHYYVYGTLNKKINAPVTPCDFISRDEKVVIDYINDPLCGNTCSVEYIHEMLHGGIKANKKSAFINTPNSLKILLISGSNDPVGGKYGKGVKWVEKSYKKNGVNNTELLLYDGARHEILNEINKATVYLDILNWLKKATI